VVEETKGERADILIVEDTQADVELMQRVLKKLDLEDKAFFVTDGEEAMDYLLGTGSRADRRLAEQPKVIVLNLKLPKVGGLEVLKQIKSHERVKSIPVVIYTASTEEQDVGRCYASGANAYVVKAVGYEELTETLTDLMRFWALRNRPPFGN